MDGMSAAANLTGGLAPELDPVPYVRADADGTQRLHLMVEGAHCAACIKRIEGGLNRRDEVVDARLNLTTRRLVVSWRDGRSRRLEAVIDEVMRVSPR